MLYRNKRTGAVIETPFTLLGRISVMMPDSTRIPAAVPKKKTVAGK